MTRTEDAVRLTYDALADGWSDWAAAVQPPLRERYLAELVASLPPKAHLLELGCGSGDPIAALAADYFTYAGIDVSDRMIARAAERVPAATFRVADMRALEIEDQSLDAVIAFHSIIHLPRADHGPLFHRIHEWLKPGGWFVASLGAADIAVEHEANWLGAGAMYWSAFDQSTYERLLRKADLDVLEADVRTQREDSSLVRFLWVRCRRP